MKRPGGPQCCAAHWSCQPAQSAARRHLLGRRRLRPSMGLCASDAAGSNAAPIKTSASAVAGKRVGLVEAQELWDKLTQVFTDHYAFFHERGLVRHPMASLISPSHFFFHDGQPDQFTQPCTCLPALPSIQPASHQPAAPASHTSRAGLPAVLLLRSPHLHLAGAFLTRRRPKCCPR